MIRDFQPSFNENVSGEKLYLFLVCMPFLSYANITTICHILFLELVTYSTFKFLLLFNSLLLLKKMYVLLEHTKRQV